MSKALTARPMLALAAALQTGVFVSSAMAGDMSAPTGVCQRFLPGGDGCLGPGFNTPLATPLSPLGWVQLSAEQARQHIQALLAEAPTGCLMNEAALQQSIAAPIAASSAVHSHPPRPLIAETPGCDALRSILARTRNAD